jgi:hypothetical protein
MTDWGLREDGKRETSWYFLLWSGLEMIMAWVGIVEMERTKTKWILEINEKRKGGIKDEYLIQNITILINLVYMCHFICIENAWDNL